MKIKVVGIVLLAALLFAFPGESFAIDTNPFAQVLEKYVNANGLVDYVGLKKSPGELKRFLSSLADVEAAELEQQSDAEQIAFWLNAYNAMTLRVIIDNYPIKPQKPSTSAFPLASIRQIPGVWDRPTFRIAGREVTLNDIQHKILRAQFAEPRIHMALVSGALGSPRLRKEPYEAKHLNRQLDEQSQSFLAEGNFRIDPEKRMVSVSPIFEWFAKDFRNWSDEGAGEQSELQGVLNFLAKYRPEAAGLLQAHPRPTLAFLAFDWSLNSQLEAVGE